MEEQEERAGLILVLGAWSAYPARDVLCRDGAEIKVEPKTMDVLVFLASRPGAVLAQREIEAAVWPDVVVTPQSLYQTIAQLRKVLGDDARQPLYIETVPRKGYRLVAQVEWRQPTAPGSVGATTVAAPAPAVRASSQPEASVLTAERMDRPRSWLSRHRWVAVAASCVIGVAIVGTAFVQRPAARQTPTSIAVLTFTHDIAASPDQDDKYLAEGISDELATALGQVAGLRVVSRNSARTAESFSSDPRDIAKRLNVTHVLEGTVRRVDGRVRVVSTLVVGDSGYHEWSRSMERPAANLMRLPTEIASSVAGALRLVLVGSAGVGGSRLGTRSPVAYDYYMLGQQRAAERMSFGLAEAARYYQQAIEVDTEFAAAFAALADVHVAEYYYANRSSAEAFALAAPLLERALELDPRLGAARGLQGLIQLNLGNSGGSEELLVEAARLAPNDAKVQLWLGGAHFQQNELREALAAFDRGLELDPLNFILHARRAILLQHMGRFDLADQSAAQAVTLAPRHPNPRWVLALIARWRGDTDQAIAHYESALALDSGRSDLRIEFAETLLDARAFKRASDQLSTAALAAQGSVDYLSAVARQAILSGDLDELPALAESLASLDAGDLYNLRSAAALMLMAGEYAKSSALYERAITLSESATLHDIRAACMGTFPHAPALALAYQAQGRGAAAVRVLDEFEGFLDQSQKVGRCWGLPYNRATVAAVRGQPDAALSQIAIAAELGWRQTWWARVDPSFSTLRGSAEFEELLRRIESS